MVVGDPVEEAGVSVVAVRPGALIITNIIIVVSKVVLQHHGRRFE